MRCLVILLLRKKLGLKKYEKFKFANQRSDAVYYFTNDSLMKLWRGQTMQSGVSINRLLDKECKIERVDE